MNSTLISIVTALGLLLARQAVAQDKPKDRKPKPTQEELEATFKATLTKATMAGRWCSIKDGVLGPEKEDKYTIVGVTKLGGDAWSSTPESNTAKRTLSRLSRCR